MGVHLLKHILPEFYQKLLPAAILNLPIDEKKATCNQCIMSSDRSRAKLTYAENLKCCTFQPFLPNYLVGAILQSDLPGRQVIEDMIARRRYSLPIGIVAPVRFQMEFNNRKKTGFWQSFGLALPLL
jgi:hypothetical protein